MRRRSAARHARLDDQEGGEQAGGNVEQGPRPGGHAKLTGHVRGDKCAAGRLLSRPGRICISDRRGRRRREGAAMAVTEDFARLTDPFRPELLAHCYRMLGSVHDAEDQVQETMIRAWRSYGEFEGRASLRTRPYPIAATLCPAARGDSSPRPH